MEALGDENSEEGFVKIPVEGVTLEGNLVVPTGARGIVVFAHGSGSGRHSPRNRYVAGVLQRAGLATLLIDLLTRREEEVDLRTLHLRFDIVLLAGRLMGVTHWLPRHAPTRELDIGYFGASTGTGAALLAAAELSSLGVEVGAIVSRGGRPDLAGPALDRVQTPTLLLVGENDPQVLALNQRALAALAARDKRLLIIPRATHLFEESGALEEVARIASDWFTAHLTHAARLPS